MSADHTNADEPIAWESTTICYTKFVSDRRYRLFSPKVQGWYKPYRCSSCTDAQSALLAQAAEKDVELDRLRADAERYRWLRESISNPVYCARSTQWGVSMIRGAPLDAAIDSARALAKQEEKS